MFGFRTASVPTVSLLALLGCAIFSGPLAAQNTSIGSPGNVTVTAPPKTAELTAERVTQLLKSVEEDENLDPELKKSLQQSCEQTLDELKGIAELRQETSVSRDRIDKLTVRIKALEDEIAGQSEPSTQDVATDASKDELNAALAARQVLLQEARSSAERLESESESRSERRKQLEASIAGAATRRAELEKQLSEPRPDDELPLVSSVNQLLLKARLQTLEAAGPAQAAELALLNAERDAGYSAARIKLEKIRIARLDQEVMELNQRVNRKRQQEAADALRQAEKVARAEFLKSNPALQELAERTRQLADENKDLTEKIAADSLLATSASKTLADSKELIRKTKGEIDRVGLTGAIGLKLRKQMRELTEPSKILAECRQRQERMRDIENQRLIHEEELESLDLPPEATEVDDEASFNFETQLKRSRYERLDALVQNYDRYFAILDSLDRDEQERATVLEEYRQYIAEHVLWIRSNKSLRIDDLIRARETLLWLLDADHWIEVARTLLNLTQSDPLPDLMFLIAFILLMTGQPKCRRELSQIGERVTQQTWCEFLPTLRALLLTVIISIPLASACMYFGWRLSHRLNVPEFSSAFGRGLWVIGGLLLGLNLIRQSCRPNGLGRAHFGWSAAGIQQMRRSLYLLMILLLPAAFLLHLLRDNPNSPGGDSLERFCFVAGRLVQAWIVFRIMNPRTGVFREFFKQHPESWFTRLHRLWFPLVTLLPVFTIILTVVGYYYSAWELTIRLNMSVCLIGGVVYLRSLLFRWFSVSQRKLWIEQARHRRQVLQEQQEEQDSVPSTQTLEEEIADLTLISDQTERLINSAIAVVLLGMLWLAWIDVLPALKVFDQWTLWSTRVETTVEIDQPDGTVLYQTEPRIQPITVGDFLLAILVLVLTWTAGRNVPGLLEIALLQRLPLEPAGRYAIRTVTRYLISVIGLVSAFNLVGIGWAKVQWLVAALTVGLGFGMQEIFANFISGLIILFERPVRIGDIVTIDQVTGVVSRIQIRATTITDWDRKEYIVPNREFITGRLLNWTLTDKTNRIVIEVGIAYGNDTALARSLLLQAAQDHPRILRDPGPIATFERFGASTLDLVLRAYLPSLDTRMQTQTELLEAINRLFTEAGLEIAFPQQDVHVRSLPQGFPGSTTNDPTDRG